MAKKLTVPAMVTVYSRAGKPELHTRANARDLVNGAGYSWKKNEASNPVAYAPFMIPQNTKFARSKAQEILDKVRAPAKDATEPTGDEEEVFDTVVDEGSIEDQPPAEADAEVVDSIEEAAPPPSTRGRRRSQRTTPPAPAPAPETE